MDAATLPSFDVAELHVAAAVLGFRHDLQTVVDTHQSASAIPRIVRPLPFVRGASVDALGSEALAREVRERCERHGGRVPLRARIAGARRTEEAQHWAEGGGDERREHAGVEVFLLP